MLIIVAGRARVRNAATRTFKRVGKGASMAVKKSMCQNHKGKKRVFEHHLSYEPEIVADCCQSCHIKIHRYGRYPEYLPQKEEVKAFYGKCSQEELIEIYNPPTLHS